ncbi:ABC transporter substrate-binding protein [Rhodoligotrophos defluvii]|uniref:ABC transporter substrate-binding protein n=1 Tax=Rhodoligotrophos defluvii TaxID=2561934 RepID=UPI0010C9D166|nr:ABC transporter substrate-binding protein [Rhodoligotrophos defluvii]
MKAIAVLGAALIGLCGPALAQETIRIGQLVDYTGPTSDISQPFGQGQQDAIAYINKNGGIAGQQISIDMFDYAYQAPRAISQYKKWTGSDKVTAILGWGTADTEALSGFVAKDQIPYVSGSYAAQISDPQGKGPRGSKPAPYNFFYGPTYSDALRGLLIWAKKDYEAKGRTDKPKYVHMGANHPYPNAPKEAGEALARELGFEVLPAIQYALTPGDYTAQCLTLKESGADYAYLGNTAGSTISLLKSCHTVGAKPQFLGNVWGLDESSAKAIGAGADGVVFAVRTPVLWNGDAPGMATLRAISAISDPSGRAFRLGHYMASVCAVYYLKEAMEWAAANGGISGENIKQGFYQKADWVPAGLEGVCFPSTWTPEDHRGTAGVNIVRAHVTGPTDAPVAELVKAGTIRFEPLETIEVERRPEWLGW